MASTVAFTTFCLYMCSMLLLALRGFFVNRKNKKNAGAAVKVDTTHFLGEQKMGTFVVR